MTRKWILPLTYKPKIQAVLGGKCTQTIRAGRKFQVGDLVSFHGWEGKPYRSKWSFGKPPIYWEITDVIPIRIFLWGFEIGAGYKIQWETSDRFAYLDGIDPPTGEELGRVLLSMHKITDEGLPAQIIRWNQEP